MIVRMEHIFKSFGDLMANKDVNLYLEEGEILGLLGENGAGKTTLMKILYGLLTPDQGAIYIRGEPVKFKSPRDAISRRLAMVSQHFSLVGPLTVTENIVLGGIPARRGLISAQEASRRVAALTKECGFIIDPQAIVDDLSVGEQQRVEILKALYLGADALILDEPTAVLTSQETDELFKIVRAMKSQKRSVIIITHKLREALMCDRVTIMRAGEVAADRETCGATEDDLCRHMFGEQIYAREYERLAGEGRRFLETKDLYVKNDRGLMEVKGISLTVHGGEIMGVAGVAGNGQKELVDAIAGLREVEQGQVLFKGRDITHYSPKQRRDAGMAHIPEERITVGSLSDFSVADNLILGREDKPQFVRWLPFGLSVLLRRSITGFAEQLVRAFDVKIGNLSMLAKHLSGGNLQKMILARELSGDPEIVLAVQPTRGLDAKTMEYVHQRLLEQRAEGKATLFVSSDLDEILSLSDHVGVIFEGQMKIFARGEVKQGEIERMMVGMEPVLQTD